MSKAWTRWLAILGVLALAGPAGIVVFMLFPIWVLAVAITLLRQPATPGRLLRSRTLPRIEAMARGDGHLLSQKRPRRFRDSTIR